MTLPPANAAAGARFSGVVIARGTMVIDPLPFAAILCRMMRILAFLAAAAALAAPASAADRRYSVTDFDRVVVEGPFAVRLTTGRPSSAVATGSQQALDRVSVEVVGRTLRIRANRSAWGGYPGERAGPVSVEISTRDLRAATVAGAGSLAIDRASGLRIDLGVEGSGRLSVANLSADVVTLGLVGSGRAELGGRAEQLRATVHGTADLDAARLVAEAATITTDSAGRIAVGVSARATVVANGLGQVEVLGSPACTVSGLTASEVRCGRR